MWLAVSVNGMTLITSTIKDTLLIQDLECLQSNHLSSLRLG